MAAPAARHPRSGGRDATNFFDGAVYGIIGGETFFKDKWFFNAEMDLGGTFASGRADGGFFLNALVGFGYMMH